MNKSINLEWLSRYVICIGVMNIIMMGVIFISRLIMRQGFLQVNALLSYIEVYAIPAVKILYAAILFLVFKKKMLHEGRTVVKELFYLWSGIAVFGQAFYYVVNIYYYRMLMMFLMEDQGDGYTMFYNNTHGFKYMAMFLFLVLGTAVTGLMLKDKALPGASLVLAALYLICFEGFNMVAIPMPGYTLGLVVSAALFHVLETIGLICLGLYLHYKIARENMVRLA